MHQNCHQERHHLQILALKRLGECVPTWVAALHFLGCLLVCESSLNTKGLSAMGCIPWVCTSRRMHSASLAATQLATERRANASFPTLGGPAFLHIRASLGPSNFSISQVFVFAFCEALAALLALVSLVTSEQARISMSAEGLDGGTLHSWTVPDIQDAGLNRNSRVKHASCLAAEEQLISMQDSETSKTSSLGLLSPCS